MLIPVVVDLSVRTFMAIWSHQVCMWSDPFVPIQQRCADGPNSDSVAARTTCKKCAAVKGPRTHHCSTCKRCVERMDHHCPWINKCVGLRNQKAFLLFLAYSCSAAVECLILIAVRLASCPSVSNAMVLFGLRLVLGEDTVEGLLEKAGPESEYANTEPTCELTLEYTIAGGVATVLMFFFVIFMTFIASDQISSIVNNQTHVEVLKGEKGPQRSLRDALVETFGMEPSLWWLVPIDWRFSGREKSD